MSDVKRLYRSETDKMIAGVAGGVGEYFKVDPTFVRLAFVVLSFGGGLGIGLYVVMWLIVPTKSSLGSGGSETMSKNVEEIRSTAKKAGEVVKAKIEEVKQENTPTESSGE